MGQQQPTSLTNHQNMSMAAGPSTSGNISPPLLSNTPSPPMGPHHNGPGSPAKPFRPKSDTERVQYKVRFEVNAVNQLTLITYLTLTNENDSFIITIIFLITGTSPCVPYQR